MNIRHIAMLIARIALAASFLSAVADRFGIWGPPGANGVSWGDWRHFLAYVGVLNSFAPPGLLPVLGVLATCAELALSILLLVGYQLRWVGYASAALLLLFGTAMTFAHGIKAPLDYSVFSASAAAFLVGAHAESASRDNSRQANVAHA